MYLFTSCVDGKKKVVAVPKKYHDQVSKLVGNWYEYRELIEKLTVLNVELMKKGELE